VLDRLLCVFFLSFPGNLTNVVTATDPGTSINCYHTPSSLIKGIGNLINNGVRWKYDASRCVRAHARVCVRSRVCARAIMRLYFIKNSLRCYLNYNIYQSHYISPIMLYPLYLTFHLYIVYYPISY